VGTSLVSIFNFFQIFSFLSMLRAASYIWLYFMYLTYAIHRRNSINVLLFIYCKTVIPDNIPHCKRKNNVLTIFKVLARLYHPFLGPNGHTFCFQLGPANSA